MTSSNSDAASPVFPTPQPEELKSEESKSQVRDRLSNTPEGEAKPDEQNDADQQPQKAKSTDPATLKNAETVTERHTSRLNTPPG